MLYEVKQVIDENSLNLFDKDCRDVYILDECYRFYVY